MTRDPAMALLRAMIAGTTGMELIEMTSRDWASATFVGARHAILLAADDDALLAAWLDALPEREFVLRGHVVIDVAVTTVERRGGRAAVTLAALTVEA